MTKNPTVVRDTDLASQAFDRAAWYALRKIDPDAMCYYFNAALSYVKLENWEFALLRAKEGLAFNAKNPGGRFSEDCDLEAKLRTIKLFSGFLHIPGTKGFEEGKEDAEWLLKHSADESEKKFARSFLAAQQSIRCNAFLS
jgi:hypothetical protein